MYRKCLIIFCTTLCIIAYLFIVVNSQKQTKPAIKNQINLREIQKGGYRRIKNNNNGNNNKRVNKVKVAKNKKKGKNKEKNKNERNNGKYEIKGIKFIINNGAYNAVKTQFEAFLKQISDSGGNAVRLLIHSTGSITPKFDSQGYATGEDTASLIQKLSQFLDTAQKYNVFAFLVLWNGARNMANNLLDLFKNDLKLDRYIEKVLKPLVSALSTKKALGAWDVIDWPQCSVRNDIVDSNPCFDTRNLFHHLEFITNNNLTMREMQKFINKHLDAIKIADSKALRSVTSKEEEASEFCDWCYNYWQNKCLISAGGKPNGVIDYYSFDAIAILGYDYYWSPLKKKSLDYKLGKPIVIASASGNCSDSKSGVTIFNNAIDWGYAGVMSWRYSPFITSSTICQDSPTQIDSSMSAIRSNDMTKITI